MVSAVFIVMTGDDEPSVEAAVIRPIKILRNTPRIGRLCELKTKLILGKDA